MTGIRGPETCCFAAVQHGIKGLATPFAVTIRYKVCKAFASHPA